LIIVIDPGHGGSANGCSAQSNGGALYEKSITLAVSRKLRDIMASAGANVLMTRNSDVDVELKARPGLANDNNAELFVSLHVDDCGVPNSASGSTAYYHMNDARSRSLAQCLIQRVGEASGLPSRGARSDRSLYVNGLSVLRNSVVPAVLVEMGYINHFKDRRLLVTAEFQQTMAQAIFDGICDYLDLEGAGAAPLTR
jgi:N-acetylmuramoyl-L-alanine amidase